MAHSFFLLFSDVESGGATAPQHPRQTQNGTKRALHLTKEPHIWLKEPYVFWKTAPRHPKKNQDDIKRAPRTTSRALYIAKRALCIANRALCIAKRDPCLLRNSSLKPKARSKGYFIVHARCGAICCSVLQFVEVCCSVSMWSTSLLLCMHDVLQCVAVCCRVLQCVVVCCSVL